MKDSNSLEAQLKWKLENMRDGGVRRYDIESAGDDTVCTHCAALEAAGPYAIDSGVLPGPPHCMTCRCALRSLD